MVSLSPGEFNLHVPQISPDDVARYQSSLLISDPNVEEAISLEKQLNYYVEDGRYWTKAHLFSNSELVKLDQIWIDAVSSNAPN